MQTLVVTYKAGKCLRQGDCCFPRILSDPGMINRFLISGKAQTAQVPMMDAQKKEVLQGATTVIPLDVLCAAAAMTTSVVPFDRSS